MVTLILSISAVAILIFAIVRCLFELVLGRVTGLCSGFWVAGSSHPPGRDRPSASAGTSPGLWPRLLRGSADNKIKTRDLRERA